jgi:hypothetical protein
MDTSDTAQLLQSIRGIERDLSCCQCCALYRRLLWCCFVIMFYCCTAAIALILQAQAVGSVAATTWSAPTAAATSMPVTIAFEAAHPAQAVLLLMPLPVF